MTILYKRYDVMTVAEVNALALTDNQENGALVLGPYSETCSWSLPYRLRNEPTETGHWSYQDGYGGDELRDGDSVTVLVPIEAEEEWGLFQDDEGTMDLYADEAESREWARIDGEGRAPSRRYTTPWEEA